MLTLDVVDVPRGEAPTTCAEPCCVWCDLVILGEVAEVMGATMHPACELAFREDYEQS